MEFKKAFSLIEMLIVLGILIVFIAATAPIFTKKFNKDANRVFHGQFECYRKPDGNVYQKLTIAGKIGTEQLQAGGTCSFTPSKKAAYYLLAMVGGGGGGPNTGGAYTGGKKGTFVTLFLKSIDASPVTMSPGIAGPIGTVGGTSTFDGTSISAPGGASGVIVPDSDPIYGSTDDCTPSTCLVKTCSVSAQHYGWPVSCAPYGGTTKGVTYNFRVYFDTGGSVDMSHQHPPSDLTQAENDTLYYQTGYGGPDGCNYYHNYAAHCYSAYDHWGHADCLGNCYWDVKFQITAYEAPIISPGTTGTTTPAEESGFDEYWQTGNYTFSVNDSGDGGANNSPGKPGAILLVW